MTSNTLEPAATDQRLTSFELDRAHSYLDQTNHGIQGALRNVSESQWKYKPGPDRWSTATAVADAAITAGLTPDTYVAASGEDANLVDALSGGAFAKPVVLTGRDEMVKVTWDELYNHRTVVNRAWVLGGTNAIGDGPAADVRHAINAE